MPAFTRILSAHLREIFALATPRPSVSNVTRPSVTLDIL